MEYLYIDHQNVAPLINTLEDVVEKAYRESQEECQKSMLRKAIYEQFSNILFGAYMERRQQVKLQPGELKEEEELLNEDEAYQIDQFQVGNIPKERGQDLQGQAIEHGKVFTRGKRQLEVQLAVVEWMLTEEKMIFEKKDIVNKFMQLWKGERRKMSMEYILKLLEKYKMWNTTVKDHRGVKHLLKFDENSSISSRVQQEGQEVEMLKSEARGEADLEVKQEQTQNEHSEYIQHDGSNRSTLVGCQTKLIDE